MSSTYTPGYGYSSNYQYAKATGSGAEYSVDNPKTASAILGTVNAIIILCICLYKYYHQELFKFDELSVIVLVVLGLTILGGMIDIVGSMKQSSGILIAGTVIIGLPVIIILIVCFFSMAIK